MVWGSSVLAEEGLLSACDVQQAPLKLWWRASLKGLGCVLSGWGVRFSMGQVLCTFGAVGSSHLFVGLLCSSCEDLHLISFRELISIGGKRSSLYVWYTAGHLSSCAWEIRFSFGWKAPPSFVAVFFSSCGRKLGVPLELWQEPQGTSCVAAGKSGLLLSCEETSWDSFRVTAGE